MSEGGTWAHARESQRFCSLMALALRPALTPAQLHCYNCIMEKHGQLSCRPAVSRRIDRRRWHGLALVIMSSGLLLALPACSSFSSSSTPAAASANSQSTYQNTLAPPPNASTAPDDRSPPAVQSAATTAVPAAPPPSPPSAAQPSQGMTTSSLRNSYVEFLDLFRDPPASARTAAPQNGFDSAAAPAGAGPQLPGPALPPPNNAATAAYPNPR